MNAVLVDLDGTLSDSFPGIRQSFVRALDRLGVPAPEDLRYIAGPPMVETLRGLGLSEKQVQLGLEYYLEDQHAGSWALTSPFPGVSEVIQAWRRDGIFVATATSKGETFARKALDHLGIEVDFMGAAEEGFNATRRTKEDVIRHVLSTCGLAPSECVMVGDRIHDVEGAAACGIDTVLVQWGYGNPTEWAAAAATVSTPDQLERIVREWN